MSCGVVHRHGSDLVLLWLWCRLAATALIGPLAWEPAHATGMTLEKTKKERKKRKKEKEKEKLKKEKIKKKCAVPLVAQWVKDVALPQAAAGSGVAVAVA